MDNHAKSEYYCYIHIKAFLIVLKTDETKQLLHTRYIYDSTLPKSMQYEYYAQYAHFCTHGTAG